MTGPFVKGQSNLGPISFDGVFLVVRRPKPKRKKVKEVRDLGGPRVINPSYFACLKSKKAFFSNKSMESMEDLSVGENRFSGSFVLCYESLTNSDVNRCNNWMNKIFDSEVSRVMWETISKLGITCNDKQEESVKVIEKMRRIDK